MGEKVLTREIVEANGWDKLEVITADMLQGYTGVGGRAFYGTPLKRIVIPETITQIGWGAFGKCNELEEVIFKGEKIDELEYECFAHCQNLKLVKLPENITHFRIAVFDYSSTITSKFEIQDYSKPVVAYKGFNKNMTCRGFQYKEGETYVFEGEPKLCECGFHACLNPLDVFNYYPLFYAGSVCHEVILEGVSKKRFVDSKVVAKKITIGRKLTKKEMIETFNKKVNLEKENNNNN